jgi:hypothetical protein
VLRRRRGPRPRQPGHAARRVIGPGGGPAGLGVGAVPSRDAAPSGRAARQ